jgi:hypothetical protein
MVEKFGKFEGGEVDSRLDFLKQRFEAEGGEESIYKGDPFDRAVNAIMLLGYSKKDCVDILSDDTNPYAGALIDILGGMPENGYQIDPEMVMKESVFSFGRDGGAKMLSLPEIRRGVHWKKKIYPELVKVLEGFGYEYEEKEAAIWELAGGVKREKVVKETDVYREMDGLKDRMVSSVKGHYNLGMEDVGEEERKILLKIGALDEMPDGMEENIRNSCDMFLDGLKPRIDRLISSMDADEVQDLFTRLYDVFKARIYSIYVLPNDLSVMKAMKDSNISLEHFLMTMEEGRTTDKEVGKIASWKVVNLSSSVKVLENATQKLFDKLIYMPHGGLQRTKSGNQLLANFERELFSGSMF